MASTGRTALALAALISAHAATARSTPFEEPPVVTRHTARIAGKALAYTAEAGRIAIRDVETGVPHAHMFYVAYRTPPAPNAQPRPLIFIWNGGPGAPSATLHYEFAGPKRLEGRALVDNDDTLLAAADIVLVDMVGTGFSRLAKPEHAPEFYGTPADARAFAEFVRAWRIAHAAEAAPLYLMGESFGSGRAANVAYLLEKQAIPVAGLVLVSGALTLPDAVPPTLATALHVADLTATAHALGRVPGDPDAARTAAERWARTTYRPALDAPDALSPADRAAVIAQLSNYTGMPAARIDAKTLRFTPRAYRQALGTDAAPRNMFDMRRLADPPIAETLALADLRGALGYRITLPYLGIEAMGDGFAPTGIAPQGPAERWDWSTAKMTPEQVAAEYARATKAADGPPRLGPPLPGAAEAMAIDPALRVLVATGLYDSYSSCAANRELVASLPPPLAPRVTFRCYEGGHMMYRDPAARRALSRDIKALVATRTPRT